MRTTYLLLPCLLTALVACQTGGDPVDPDGAGGAGNGGGVAAADTERAEREASETAAADAYTEVLVETWNGSVKVLGSAAAGDISVSATLFAMGSTADQAGQRAAAIQLVAAPDPDTPSRLHVRAEFPGGQPPVSHGGHLSLTLPPGPKIVVRSHNSWVRVTHMGGDVDIQTNKAEVTVLDVAGSVNVKTTEKAVKALRIGGNVEVSTTVGRIECHEFGGRLKLVNGSGGDIEIYHDKPSEPVDIVARTTSGRISSELPGTLRAMLSISAPNGKVITEDLADGIQIGNPIRTKDAFHGKLLGGGEGKIEYHADNGTVEYRVKEFTKPVGGGN